MRILMSLLFLATAACASGTKTATTAVDTKSTTATTTPKQACEGLAKAAMDGNYAAFKDLTVMPMMWCKDGEKCPMMGSGTCSDKTCPMHKHGKKRGKDGGRHGHHAYGHPEGLGSEEGFKKMHENEIARLKDLACKDEKVAGDRAWVEATTQNETRLVPFRLMEGQWKFDIKTYHSFYHRKSNPTETSKTE